MYPSGYSIFFFPYQKYAEEEEIAFYMETSAKSDTNVDELFLAVAKKLEGRYGVKRDKRRRFWHH